MDERFARVVRLELAEHLDPVRGDHVHALGHAFGPRVFRDRLGLGGKPDREGRIGQRGDLGQDIRVAHQRQVQLQCRFLELLCGRL